MQYGLKHTIKISIFITAISLLGNILDKRPNVARAANRKCRKCCTGVVALNIHSAYIFKCHIENVRCSQAAMDNRFPVTSLSKLWKEAKSAQSTY
uniref:Secreted protein n=1 Tax=Pyxicephalus adspersus TaxID=30357 RepID=A0AAV2ZHP5_PYXAD|nr:TPA: hypothetical protein GDO54_002540 [Pyxicephalus adspersus]